MDNPLHIAQTNPLNNPRLIYDEQVLANVAPFLTLKDLLSTATLSKEFHYLLKNHIKHAFIPHNSPHNQEFSTLKAIYNREAYVYDFNTQETIRCPIPKTAKYIHSGHIYTLIELYGRTHILMDTQDLLSGKKTPSIPLKRKYTTVKLINERTILGCIDNRIWKMSLDAPEKEESIQFPGKIEQIVSSSSHSVLSVRIKEHIELYLLRNEEEILKPQMITSTGNLISVSHMVLGKGVGYILANQLVFMLDLNEHTLSEYTPFQSHKITALTGGKFHFFASERLKPQTSTWTNQEVIAWAQEQGFEDYVKILKVEKVTGKMLLQMNKKYMEDKLGLINVKLQQKLMLKIAEGEKDDVQNCTLYGWGSNFSGQLGIYAKEQSTPIKIKFPLDCILFQCLQNETVILNKKTKVISASIANEWKPITNKQVHSLAIVKNKAIFICAVRKERIPQMLSANVESSKKEKLRTAKNIVDKISWDENIKKEEFRVGYLDKYEGTLEIPFDQMEQSEVKQYRIEYFKRNGEVVWSKKDRIDTL